MKNFSTPQQTYLYPNGDIRVVGYSKITEGESFEYLNMIQALGSKPVTAIAVSIKEDRPSLGVFAGEPPTSYRITIL